ncbi:hypothetical protein Acr_22g0002990 [Actinidia rufa]|uniref:Uncharacterized protein n=1 Tax=Actinidia rufa TaxID=165716 RepID=A0A7J0GJI7_9ERIC|nr:hypothetical protein Acr_22g0002990 [Actinidia rufa]
MPSSRHSPYRWVLLVPVLALLVSMSSPYPSPRQGARSITSPTSEGSISVRLLLDHITYHHDDGIAGQIKIMNENNALLIQHLSTNNAPPPAIPIPEEVDQSCVLVDQETVCLEVAKVQVGRVRLESSDVDHQADDRAPRCRDRSTTQKIRDLNARIDAINTRTNALVTVDALIRQAKPLFIEKVMRTRVSSRNIAETQSAFQSKVDKYIAVEELTEAKRKRQGMDDHKRKEIDSRRAEYRNEIKNRPDRDVKRNTNDRRPRTLPRLPDLVLPLLNTPIAQELMEIKHE